MAVVQMVGKVTPMLFAVIYVSIGSTICGLLRRTHPPGHIKWWEWPIAIAVWPLLLLVMAIMIIIRATDR